MRINRTCIAVTAAFLLFSSRALSENRIFYQKTACSIDKLESLCTSPGISIRHAWLKTDNTVRMISGVLSEPSTLKASTIARDFLTRHKRAFSIPDISHVSMKTVIRSRAGRVVRLNQNYRGIPVIDSSITVRVDSEGRVRQVVNGLKNLLDPETEPAVTAEEAVEALLSSDERLYPVQFPEDISARLVLVPKAGSGAWLAWELHTGAVPQLLSNWYIYIDAVSGKQIFRHNRLWFDRQAWVFETNPVHTPEEKKVKLDIPLDYEHPGAEAGIRTVCDQDIAGGDSPFDCTCGPGDCLWLSDPLFSSRNCIDLHETINLNIHMCSQVQTAHGDENMDFLFDPRLPDNTIDDLNPEDQFTEVAMYYHVNKVYDFFSQLSGMASGTDHPVDGDEWTGMASTPLLATVNFRLPVQLAEGTTPTLQDLLSATDPYGDLYPFDNAMFMPGGEGGIPGMSSENDQIIFGQGSSCDFSWDGDVIYHEFTHGVTNVIADGIWGWALDDWGSVPCGGAMNEGFSDYFPGVITDEPQMGEYSLRAFGEDKLRTLENEDVCPWYFIGEVHHDSKGWAGSLWDGMNLIADGDRDKEIEIASLFMGAESMLTVGTSFDEAAQIFVDVIQDELGQEAADLLLEGFDNHHMYMCERYFDLDDLQGREVPVLPVPAASTLNLEQGWAPAITQFRKDIPEPGVWAVQIDVPFSGNSPGLLIKHGDEHIRIDYEDGVASSDADVEAMEMEPAGNNKFRYTFEPENGINAGYLWLMVVNQGQSNARLAMPAVTLGNPKPGGGQDAGGNDSSEQKDDAGVDEAGQDEESGTEGGCGCSTAGKKHSALTWQIISTIF